MPVALFGITNDALNLVVNLLVLFLVVLWLALVAWTYFDARRRIEDPVLVACATAASLFPFVGTIVYSILRPPEFLADKRERELEIRASELRVRQLEEASCPNCEHPVERTFLRCPNCRARIKDPCESCGKPIDPRWAICPYCETPQRRAAPPERRPRERQAPPEADAPAPRRRRSRSRRPRRRRRSATRTREPLEPAPPRAARAPAGRRHERQPTPTPRVALATQRRSGSSGPPSAEPRPSAASARHRGRCSAAAPMAESPAP